MCSVPTPGTLPIQVDAAAGNDTVFNFTDVGMDATGSEGNDTLHGSVTAPDILVGTHGGRQARGQRRRRRPARPRRRRYARGGDGERDVVSYDYRIEPVRASIGSGSSGEGKEKDVIGRSVEQLCGARATTC